jgi:hypothetical protein
MRPIFINEKFEEIADPIQDMGIGGFVPFDVYNKMMGPSIKKWEKVIKDSIENKTLQGTFMLSGNTETMDNLKVFVTEVHFYANGHIEVERPDGKQFGLKGTHKYKIIDNS